MTSIFCFRRLDTYIYVSMHWTCTILAVFQSLMSTPYLVKKMSGQKMSGIQNAKGSCNLHSLLKLLYRHQIYMFYKNLLESIFGYLSYIRFYKHFAKKARNFGRKLCSKMHLSFFYRLGGRHQWVYIANLTKIKSKKRNKSHKTSI